jgi:NAD(P)-dependent dehydrogenase (short-subunit alcohol dehydrogenase family)
MTVFLAGLLTGRNAFIAGGTSGINLAIATRMHSLGAKVFVISRSPEKVADAVELLGGKDQSDGHAVDVRDFEGVQTAVTACVQRFGKIDIVVSGAAGNFLAPAAALTPKGFRTIIEIDLIGGFHVMKAAYPHLRRPGASIINISALQSVVALPDQAHASAAKAGLDALVRALALEWGPEGIRVNSISPGPVSDTEGMRRLAPTPEAAQNLTASIPLKRWADKEDIAELAVFLASDAGANISGTTIISDGGFTAARTY